MTAMSTADREIVQERLLNAPRETVFDVYTSPDHLNQWWGPRGYTITIHEMEVKPGGVWRFIMHGPDGKDWNNIIVYSEVVRPERLVFNHGSGEEGDAGFHVTVTFDEEGAKTKLKMRMLFESAEACEAVKAFGAVELGQQTIDKLEEYLAQLS